jgi:hypothetical protein
MEAEKMFLKQEDMEDWEEFARAEAESHKDQLRQDLVLDLEN